MKKFFFIISVFSSLLTVAQSGRVDADTKEYSFISSLGKQYMFYGYTEPDSKSKKLILFSTFPDNISSNANYNLPLGAYHETTSLKTGSRIKYKGRKKGYAEMEFTDADNKTTTFYLKRGYVRN